MLDRRKIRYTYLKLSKKIKDFLLSDKSREFLIFLFFFRLVFDIRLPCSILYNDMELTIRGVVPTALHTPAFFRAGQTRRFFA